MAGLATGKDGLKRITFTIDGKPKVIRIGRMGDSGARTFQTHIGAIVAARDAGVPMEPSTVKWLAGLSDELHARVAAHGLVEPRQAKQAHTLGELLDAFYATLDAKPASKVARLQTRPGLEAHLGGPGRDVATITPRELAEWRVKLLEELSKSTANRRCKDARAIFAKAVRWKMLSESPAADLKTGKQTNSDRQVFVPRETVAKVMRAAPDLEWRLLIALGRYGGLRVPSEALALTWADVLWDANRIRVDSSKTGVRFTPIFPELADLLRESFEQAEDGAVHVVAKHRNHTNLNVGLRRIIDRAGIESWPKTWHNLRASRATELAQSFPGHVAAAWLGHTEAIADMHYRMVRDEDFDRAATGGDNKCGNEAAINPAIRSRPHESAEVHKSTEAPAGPRLTESGGFGRTRAESEKVTPRGFEPRFSG